MHAMQARCLHRTNSVLKILLKKPSVSKYTLAIIEEGDHPPHRSPAAGEAIAGIFHVVAQNLVDVSLRFRHLIDTRCIETCHTPYER